MSKTTMETETILPTYTSHLPSMDALPRTNILELTTDIASSYLSNASLDVAEVPTLIRTIHETLCALNNQSHSKSLNLSRLDPAVPIEDSVQPDYIVCLEDGKHLQVLKRHLKTAFGLTIEEYKKRWGLSADYPTVAPNYSIRRSSIAKDTGLGNTPKQRRSKLTTVSAA